MSASRRVVFTTTAVLSLAGLLTACGDAVDTTGRGLQVFRLGTDGARSGAAESTAAVADKMMMFQPTEFVFDGDLPALPESAASYLLSSETAPSDDQIRALAATLGVQGDVRAVSPEMGGGWMVGPEDYSGATLTVSADGLGSWWFNPDPSVWETSAVVCESVVAEPAVVPSAPDSTDVPTPEIDEPCLTPEPPSGVPSADQALDELEGLMARWGDDAQRYEFETYADEWNASATGFLLVDGARTTISVSASFGAEGVLQWASGSLIDPQRGADYPLAGAATGLARLNDETGQWMYYGAPAMMARNGAVGVSAVTEPMPTLDTVPVDTALPVDTATTVEAVVVSTDDTLAEALPSDCDPASDCVLIDPMVPTEPITVHLDEVAIGLTLVWDLDGVAWLLPAYNFTSVDGASYSVLAVADEFIEVPEVTDVFDTPTPTDGSGGGDVPAEFTDIDLDEARTALSGLTEDEAAAVAAERGWTLRVVMLDGESLPATMDYRTDRVNVAVEAGVVVSVESVG